MVAYWEDVVAYYKRCGGTLLEMWWLNAGNVVAYWEDVVAYYER